MNVTELFRKAPLWLLCLMMTFTGLYGQTAPAILNKQMRVPVKKVNIDALGDIITQQTGLILSFNSQKIGARQQVRLQQPSYTIRQLLTMIKVATGADYTIYQEHVIFHRFNVHNTPKKEIKPSIPVAAAPKKTVIKKPLPDSVHAKKTTAAVRLLPVRVARANAAVMPSLQGTRTLILKPSPAPAPLQSAIRSMQRERTDRRFFKLFAQGGITTDEIYYANAEVKAGLGLIYGIGIWGSNFSISGFRYGLGSSIALRNKWRLELEATTGSLSKASSITIPPDTFRLTLEVRSRLNRAALLVQKEIGPHIAVHAGPVFNHLKSTYYRNGTARPLTEIFPNMPDAGQTYYTIKPPYTLSNSAPDRTDNIKTWIGLQAGVSYRF
jgi:hypothetical protein